MSPPIITIETDASGAPIKIRVAYDDAIRNYPTAAAEAWFAASMPGFHLVPNAWWPSGPGFWGCSMNCTCYARIAPGRAPTKRQWVAATKARSFTLDGSSVGADGRVLGLAALAA